MKPVILREHADRRVLFDDHVGHAEFARVDLDHQQERKVVQAGGDRRHLDDVDNAREILNDILELDPLAIAVAGHPIGAGTDRHGAGVELLGGGLRMGLPIQHRAEALAGADLFHCGLDSIQCRRRNSHHAILVSVQQIAGFALMSRRHFLESGLCCSF